MGVLIVRDQLASYNRQGEKRCLWVLVVNIVLKH